VKLLNKRKTDKNANKFKIISTKTNN
jgi:hypothetical protein